MIAFASSLDQGGVISQSAEDAAMVLGAMAGFDPRDSTSVDTPVPNYVESLNAPLAGLQDRAHQGVLRQGPRRLRREAHPRGAQGLREARREAGRGQTAGAAAVRAHLLRGGAGRVFVEPRALRRRALRLSRQGSERSDGPLQALARRGLRRRGQAPHHDGHVRAVGRLLRRVLPQGAARAAVDQPGLQARVRAKSTCSWARPRPTSRSASARRRPIRSRCISTTSTPSARTSPACRPCPFPAGSCAICPWACRSPVRISRKRSCSTWRTRTRRRPTGIGRIPAAFKKEKLS